MDLQLIVGRLTYVLWFVFCTLLAVLVARGSRAPEGERDALSVAEWACVGVLLGLPLAVLVSLVEGGPGL